ncbi:unnamed protein product [Paramecium octaurelia]|uniref:Uncharacterized protein n=1 Tax=Paramecium octaurelia TaxID=43137 RepID=A0A8S1U907_PAROT|nr:unnamed protein product [Paramecium octaurelia]
MNIDLIKVIEKNQQKLDQHSQKLSAQARDIYALTILYGNSNFKSSSIERSYVSTRKSTKQNSVVPNKSELSRLIDSSSPISVKQSHIDQIASVSPNRDDLTRIRMENAALKEKMNSKEKQIDQLDKTINALKKEKDLMIQQYQNTINRITKELEIGKKNAMNVEQALQDQIKFLEQSLEKNQNNDFRLKEMESTMQTLILENEQLKQQKKDDAKWLRELQEQFEIFYTKSQETKNKIEDTKHFISQLSEITQYLINKQAPPLEFFVHMNKLQKQQKVDATPLPKGSSMKLIFAQVFSLQIESLVTLNQILKDTKTQVEKFSNQYISQVGLQLVSL